MKHLLIGLAIGLASTGAFADSDHSTHSKYAGQQNREIKSLSEEDVAELRRGGGWGLALAAELNGVPGPAHLLELKDSIHLSEDQVASITALFNRMQKKAIKLGGKLIEQERDLEKHFQELTITDEILQSSLKKIEKTRRQLRYTHLVTHLETPKILSDHQIMMYNDLRGYGEGDPCDNVPEGHDADMWRKHNGCE